MGQRPWTQYDSLWRPLNATLKDEHRINYADSISLLPGDSLLRDCFSSTGASVVSGNDVITWKSKVGQQQA
eukprot:521531-Rhodomonas_salina.1